MAIFIVHVGKKHYRQICIRFVYTKYENALKTANSLIEIEIEKHTLFGNAYDQIFEEITENVNITDRKILKYWQSKEYWIALEALIQEITTFKN